MKGPAAQVLGTALHCTALHCTALEVMGVAGRRSSPVILVFVLLNVFYQDVL